MKYFNICVLTISLIFVFGCSDNLTQNSSHDDAQYSKETILDMLHIGCDDTIVGSLPYGPNYVGCKGLIFTQQLVGGDVPPDTLLVSFTFMRNGSDYIEYVITDPICHYKSGYAYYHFSLPRGNHEPKPSHWHNNQGIYYEPLNNWEMNEVSVLIEVFDNRNRPYTLLGSKFSPPYRNESPNNDSNFYQHYSTGVEQGLSNSMCHICWDDDVFDDVINPPSSWYHDQDPNPGFQCRFYVTVPVG